MPMRRTSTLPAPSRWNDPFRLLLAISLVVLVAWIVVQSGAQEAATRTRTIDIDPGDAASIVAYDDSTLFDMPVVEPLRDDGDGAAPTPAPVASPAATGGSRGGSRSGSRQPATGGATATTPQPPSTGGGATTAPVTGGETQTGPGNGPAPQAPIVSPGTPGTAGTPGLPGTDNLPGAPAVELPVPTLPGSSGATGQGGGAGVTGDAIQLARVLVIGDEPVASS